MAAFEPAQVKWIHHWNERLFSLGVDRKPTFRFVNGHFTMLGLAGAKTPTMRAYSIASPEYEDHLEFLSIKVADGALTSRLAHVQPGDTVLLGQKPVGSLLLSDLHPGRNLYLFSTGTGIAPFMAIIRDPEVYEKFDHVVLAHGVRRVSDLAYRELLSKDIFEHPYIGEYARSAFIYYPTVTQEPFENEGRITTALTDGRLSLATGLPALEPEHDRAMICGSMAVLKDLSALLDSMGFSCSPNQGEPGDYVIERSFVG